MASLKALTTYIVISFPLLSNATPIFVEPPTDNVRLEMLSSYVLKLSDEIKLYQQKNKDLFNKNEYYSELITDSSESSGALAGDLNIALLTVKKNNKEIVELKDTLDNTKFKLNSEIKKVNVMQNEIFESSKDILSLTNTVKVSSDKLAKEKSIKQNVVAQLSDSMNKVVLQKVVIDKNVEMIESLNNTLKNKNETIASLEDKYSFQSSDLDNKLTILNNKLSKSKQSIKDLTGKLDEVKSKKSKALYELKLSNESIKDMVTNLKDASKINNTLKVSLSESDTINKSMLLKLIDTEDKIKRHKGLSSELITKNATLESSKSKSIILIKKLNEEIYSKDTVINKLRDEAIKNNSSLDLAQKSIVLLKDNLELAKKSNDKAIADYALESEKNNLINKNLLIKSISLEKSYASSITALDASGVRVKTLNDDILNNKKTILKLNTDLSTSNKKLKVAQLSLSVASSKNDTLVKDNVKINTMYESVSLLLNKTTEKLKAGEERLLLSEKINTALTVDINALTVTTDADLIKVAELNAKINELSKKNLLLIQADKAFQVTLLDSHDLIEGLQSSLNDTQQGHAERVKQLNTSLATKNSKINNISDQLMVLNDKNAELTSTVGVQLKSLSESNLLIKNVTKERDAFVEEKLKNTKKNNAKVVSYNDFYYKNHPVSFTNVDALNAIRLIVGDSWELKLSPDATKKLSVSINFFSDKTRVGSLSEILTGFRLNYKVIKELNIIVIS